MAHRLLSWCTCDPAAIAGHARREISGEFDVFN